MKGFYTLFRADLIRWKRAGMLWVQLLLVLAFAGSMGLLMRIHLGADSQRFVYELGQFTISLLSGLVLVLSLFPRLQEGVEGEGAYWLSQPITRATWGLAHGVSALAMSMVLVVGLQVLWGVMMKLGMDGQVVGPSHLVMLVYQCLGLVCLEGVVFIVTGIFHSAALASASGFLLIVLGLLSERLGSWAWVLPDLSRYQLSYGLESAFDWGMVSVSLVQTTMMIVLGLWLSGKKD